MPKKSGYGPSRAHPQKKQSRKAGPKGPVRGAPKGIQGNRKGVRLRTQKA